MLCVIYLRKEPESSTIIPTSLGRSIVQWKLWEQHCAATIVTHRVEIEKPKFAVSAYISSRLEKWKRIFSQRLELNGISDDK